MNSPNRGGVLIRKDEACKFVKQKTSFSRVCPKALVETLTGRIKLEIINKANRLELQSTAAPKSLFYDPYFWGTTYYITRCLFHQWYIFTVGEIRKHTSIVVDCIIVTTVCIHALCNDFADPCSRNSIYFPPPLIQVWPCGQKGLCANSKPKPEGIAWVSPFSFTPLPLPWEEHALVSPLPQARWNA